MTDKCHRGKPHLWFDEEGGQAVHETSKAIVRECATCHGHRWFPREGLRVKAETTKELLEEIDDF